VIRRLAMSWRLKYKENMTWTPNSAAKMVALCLLFGGSFFPTFPAFAQDINPFALENQKWLSLDAYEEEKEKAEAAPIAQKEKEPSEDETKVALPERAIDLPALPGMTPVASLTDPSTEEENEIFLNDESKWREISDLTQEALDNDRAQAIQADLAAAPFSVRFAPLPNLQIKAIADSRISRDAADRQKVVESVVKKKVSPPKPKYSAPPEACVALADMRRRQLEAIESDRQTLSALKEALSQLGLSESLGYMANGEAVLSEEPVTKVQ